MATAFDLPVGSDAANEEGKVSLQDAFLEYRRKRQDELRVRQLNEQLSLEARSDPVRMEELRRKFLERAMSYTGTPYARRYHPPESPTYKSELFLDCCGLVRRILKDLKEEFGFTIGPWNQAYMYDTLPINLSGPEEMKPGDLVFVSGVYYNDKAKKQRHNMVHVEIWLGDDHKCLGARWQKRFVEVHDSYQFVSKSYHSMTYHFKSIDTWLKGICKSVCPEHPWQVRKFDPSKRSIFALSQKSEACDSGDDGEACDCGEPCEDNEACDSGEPCEDSELRDSGTSKLCEDSEAGEPCDSNKPGMADGNHKPADDSQVIPDHPSSTSMLKKSASSDKRPSTGKNPPIGEIPPSRESKRAKSTGASGSRLARTFITCGGNCSSLVESDLTSKGWVKCEDKSSTSFTLKWTELKTQIDYKLFREGEQIVNHFPNISLLTSKIGLLESLRSYCKIHRLPVKMDSFFPLTYRLDSKTELEEFVRTFTAGELWICKPTGANQGKGIFLVRQLAQVLEKLEYDKLHCKPTSRPTPRIVQRYISNPLLLDDRKFDIRVYMLVVAARPFLVFYRQGYVRLCCDRYSLDSECLTVHLTNQYQQKKHPKYTEVKEDTVWDFDKFQGTLVSEHGLPDDWVQTTLKRRMVSIMLTCFNSVKHKLNPSTGYFDLLGFDFMLDQSLNVWLIEININPALHTNCETLATVSPSVVSETLDIAIEVFDKNRRNRPLLPISSLRNFVRINC